MNLRSWLFWHFHMNETLMLTKNIKPLHFTVYKASKAPVDCFRISTKIDNSFCLDSEIYFLMHNNLFIFHNLFKWKLSWLDANWIEKRFENVSLSEGSEHYQGIAVQTRTVSSHPLEVISVYIYIFHWLRRWIHDIKKVMNGHNLI